MASPYSDGGQFLSELADHPTRFSFFRAMRQLKTLAGGLAGAARLRGTSSLCFPVSELEACEEGDGGQAELVMSFFGLFGQMGELSYAYTEEILNHEREGARTDRSPLRDFLDILNHRLGLLFYEAWERAQLGLLFEGDWQAWREKVAAPLGGLSPAGAELWPGLSDQSLLWFGDLAHRAPRSASALGQLLTEYLGVPAEVLPRSPSERWVPLSPEALELARRERLARVDGERVLDPLGRFRVRLGPFATLEKYLLFLPGGEQFPTLLALVALYADVELELDLELVLRAEAPEACRLNDPARARLNWTAWLAGAREGDQAGVVSAELVA